MIETICYILGMKSLFLGEQEHCNYVSLFVIECEFACLFFNLIS